MHSRMREALASSVSESVLLGDEAAGDCIQHSVEEVDGLGGGVAAADFKGFVDDDGEGRSLEAQHLAHGHAEQVAIHGRHTLQAPVLGVKHEEFVDLLLVGDSYAEQVLGKAAHLGLDLVAGLPEGGAHLVGGLLADVRLKEHLHGQLARLAARSGGQDEPPSAGLPLRSLRRRLTISMAATAASNPLLPALMPARLSACSRVSQLSTPKLWGMPVSCCDWPMPRATSL